MSRLVCLLLVVAASLLFINVFKMSRPSFQDGGELFEAAGEGDGPSAKFEDVPLRQVPVIESSPDASFSIRSPVQELDFESATQSRSDFLSENARRLAKVHDTCQALKAQTGGIVRKKRSGQLSVCVPGKCGSSSWEEFFRWSSDKLVGISPTRIMVVRHPLSRLMSAYRDKYLNGAPISTFTDAYRKLTHSGETWNNRWANYWLPALISRGDVKASSWLKNVYKTKRNESNPCRLSLLLSPKDFKIQFLYNLRTLNEDGRRFANATFTFLDFLKHVLWTRDHGVIDKHWTHQYCVCKACEVQYDFMLDTDNVGEESRHVFDILNIAKGVHVGSVHSTKKALQASDAGYFDGVPKDIMDQIMLLYKNDFDVLGFR